MNTYPIKYVDKSLWTSRQLIDLMRLLLIEQVEKAKFDTNYLHLLLDDLDRSYDLNLDKLIITDNKEFLILLEMILRRLDLDSYFKENEFAHSIWKIIASKYDRKKASKVVSDIPSINKTQLVDLINQIVRLVKGEDIFDVDTNASIENIVGDWMSFVIEFEPQFDINFNMTDLTPSRNEIKLKINKKEKEFHCCFIIQALDYLTKKTVELALINGIMSLENGYIKIKEINREFELPILKSDENEFFTFVFRTKIGFKKTKTH